MKSRLFGAMRACLMVVLTGTALPVSAALIYEWVSTGGNSAIGSIELNAGIGVGDTFDPLTDIAVFEFNVNSTDYSIAEFFNKYTSWEAGSLRLCAPNCIDYGSGESKAPKTGVAFRAVRTEIAAGVYDQYWTFLAFEGAAIFSGDGDWVPVSAVPVPAAAWLFGSGLLGLVGMARGKKVA